MSEQMKESPTDLLYLCSFVSSVGGYFISHELTRISTNSFTYLFYSYLRVDNNYPCRFVSSVGDTNYSHFTPK